jgi:hypothetical protein
VDGLPAPAAHPVLGLQDAEPAGESLWLNACAYVQELLMLMRFKEECSFKEIVAWENQGQICVCTACTELA